MKGISEEIGEKTNLSNPWVIQTGVSYANF